MSCTTRGLPPLPKYFSAVYSTISAMAAATCGSTPKGPMYYSEGYFPNS